MLDNVGASQLHDVANGRQNYRTRGAANSAGTRARGDLSQDQPCDRHGVRSPRESKWSLRQKPAIPSTGIRQSKRRLLGFAGFSAAAQMSSPSVGRIARRGAAGTHLPVQMSGSVGFAKNQKSNARHVQIRHSRPSMTCRSNGIYAGTTRMAPRSLWASTAPSSK
jgi:hypothetical protein